MSSSSSSSFSPALPTSAKDATSRPFLHTLPPEQQAAMLKHLRFSVGQAMSEEEFKAMRAASAAAGTAGPQIVQQLDLGGGEPKAKLKDRLKELRLARTRGAA